MRISDWSSDVCSSDLWAHEQLMRGDGDLHARLQEIVEAALLRRTLREVRGNQLEAARRLGINRNTLRKRLGQLAIDPAQRSEARRVGKACVSTGRSRRSPYH